MLGICIGVVAGAGIEAALGRYGKPIPPSHGVKYMIFFGAVGGIVQTAMVNLAAHLG